MSIGKAVLRIRQERRATQAEVGRRARLATSYISRIENGHVQPTMATLGRLAAALGVPVSAIFGVSERGEPTVEARCPVSASGLCIGESIRSHRGRRPRGRDARYGRAELRLLKMTDYVALHGSKKSRAALTVVLESLVAQAGGGTRRKKTSSRR